MKLSTCTKELLNLISGYFSVIGIICMIAHIFNPNEILGWIIVATVIIVAATIIIVELYGKEEKGDT